MTVHADRLERGAAAVAVTALAIWIGGLVALGACAAPIVFRVVPAPLSGDAMGAVFRRFDAIAVACSVFVLGCEAIRIWVRDPPATAFERARTAPGLSPFTRRVRFADQVPMALSSNDFTSSPRQRRKSKSWRDFSCSCCR